MRAPYTIERGGPVMARVCAWCKAGMGFEPCLPRNAGKVTHGICDACMRREFEALPGPVRPTLNASAAVPVRKFPPGIVQPTRVNGTTAPAGKPVAVLEHPSGGPADAFFDFCDRLIKRLLTGRWIS